MLGELFLTHNNVAAGRAELEKVAVEDPKYPGTYLLFANLALTDGRITDAQLLLDRAESLEGELKDGDRKKTLQTSVRSAKVSICEARKDWPGVIKTTAEWLTIDPESGKARQRKARALVAQGQIPEATKELEAAYQHDKTMLLPDLALATFFSEFNDYKSAEECLLRAAKAFPKDAKVQQSVANWMLMQDRAKDAAPYVVEALKIDPTSIDARYLAGMIARNNRDYKTAETSFETVLRDAPANFPASNQLTLILADQDDETKRRRAVEMAEMNARQYPRSADAVATLGWVYYRAGKLDQAEQALQSAISGGRATSDMAYYLAHVMADRGRIDDAAKLLQGALKAQGNFTFRKEAQSWLDRITSKPKK
jgi:Tfp pilus assembly protein PilF